MESDKFKEKLRTGLTVAGILVDGDTSIFSTQKVVTFDDNNNAMLTGPENSAWAFVSSAMQEDEINSIVNEFVGKVRTFAQVTVHAPRMNMSLPLSDYLKGMATLFGGNAPKANLDSTPVKTLVQKCMPYSTFN